MADTDGLHLIQNEQRLQDEITRLNKVVNALMNHAERSASVQRSDFGMFQTAVMLENQVRHRTNELEAVAQENARINRALQHEQGEQRLLIRRLEDAHCQLLQAKTELEQLSQQQAQALSLLNATLEASPDGVAAFNLAGELIACNQNYVQLWQLSPELLAACDATVLQAHCARQIRTPVLWDQPWALGEVGVVDEVMRCDGRVLERHVSPQIMAGEQTGVVLHWHDITERKREEAQRNRMAHILERSLNEIYLFDPVTLRFEYANAGALSNLGYDLATLRQMTPVDVKPAYDEATFRLLIRPLLEGQTERLVFETVHCRADGSVYDVQIHLELDTEDEKSLLMALVLDITERKRAQALIWTQANFDDLTQLPNRSMLQDRLAQEIAKAQRNACKLAVLFIDLDKFKEINDTLGHDKGDQLLRVAAQRIRACVRASDTVARVGGDEFVVLLSALEDGRMASDVAQCLINRLAQPCDLSGTEVIVSGSIGITLYPDDAPSGEGLLKNADQAMYVSKTRGRNQFSYFTRELEQAAQRRMYMVSQLRHAVALGQFFLHFQPIVEIATGRISKAEALIRWQHPEMGLVSPLEFIGLAEETGLIVAIGDWVFDEAVRWVRRWRERYHINFQVSVNKSPVQFLREKEHACTWALKLHQQGLPGSCVSMEITESLLIDGDSHVQAALQGCREAGIEVAIDDFGTGYSSLAYLKRFDIDCVKIDRSFIANLAPGSSDLALSQAIIVMAHALGLKVVGEGVETQAQLALLTEAGCDFAQGYLFARPLPPDELERLLVNARSA